MPNTINTKEIMQKWRYDFAIIRKPKLEEACEQIEELCIELAACRKRLAVLESAEKGRQCENNTMLLEIENLVRKYRKTTL